MSGDNLIEIKNLSRIYQTGKIELKALDNFSMEVKRGEFLAIMGPSGSGKSTLMNILGCLDRTSSGSYFLDGEEISRKKSSELVKVRRDKIGFIFQTFNLLARIPAARNVELPLVYSQVKRRQRKERVAKVLEAVGLTKRAHHKPNELSGGEQQRVAIARALINNPSVILADEPTGNLDSRSSLEIIKILKDLNQQGKTIIMVTHDQDLALLANRIIKLKDGQLVI